MADAQATNVKHTGAGGRPAFVSGLLGSVDAISRAALRASAKSALQNVLIEHFGAEGNEEMIDTKVFRDGTGNFHVRFEQRLNGLPVAGAGMVLHADADGSVFAVNGDFVSGKDLPDVPALGANAAFGRAQIQGNRASEPELSYVLGSDGRGHLAWKATFEYVNAAGPQQDVVFVDTTTGKVAARHPQIKYARTLETQDCDQKTRNCRVVSRSSEPIGTNDQAIDDAHNYAIATYEYYFKNFERDSIDDAGTTLVSRVHYSRNYNNAFWDGAQMTYGDGDGVTFEPLSQDADVVAHELTHGITERTSGLIYQNESGALNEAWSDIFGAMVDRETGATGADIWLIGEDIYTPGIPGDALRNMADPAQFGDYDYYPDRYTGTADNGGVHWNSGIANLAFQLLVDGDSHPRGKTEVTVQGIDFDAASDIFYNANVACLTPSSNFAAARYCTADLFGGNYASNVHAAWDAVGVPNDPPELPPPPIELTHGEPLSGQSGNTGDVQQYLLGVQTGESVTCETACNNGDADLYLRFGAEAEVNPNSTSNECGSYSSNSYEGCTTGTATSPETLYAAVHAYASYTDLTVTCTIENNGSGGACLSRGASCTTGADCCSGSCGGKPGSRTCR
ncbi:MAG: M4 family metallopeptidase [Caldilineaceae bacterium]